MYQVILQSLPPLSFDGDVSENWKKFETLIPATESTNKIEVFKISILLHAIGDDAQEKYEIFDIPDADKNISTKSFRNLCA